MTDSTKRIAQFVMITCGLWSVACFGDLCQDATATVVEGAVKGSKQVSRGIVDGVKQGRKAGESIDGALIATSWDEVDPAGHLEVHAIVASADAASSSIEIAVQNSADVPLRLSGMTWTVLDREGFATPLTGQQREETVPPLAKERIVLQVPRTPDDVSAVRLWGRPLAMVPAGHLQGEH